MCGITGVISRDLNHQNLRHLKGLMIMSCFRGMEGSGAMFAHKEKIKGKEHLFGTRLRRLTTAAELAMDDEFLELAGKSDIVVTHARLPTKGETKIEMLHPHKKGHIFLVHNGTMYRVDDKYIQDKESDSAAIAVALAEKGIEEFVKESSGAYSLVWFDLRTRTVNFLRNDQRPMAFANVTWTDKSQSLYFASETNFLRYVLERDLGKLDGIDFFQSKPDVMLSYSMDVGKIPELVGEKEIKKPPIVYGGYNRGANSPWESNYEDYWEAALLEKDQQKQNQLALPAPRRVDDKVVSIAARLQSEAMKRKQETFRSAIRARRERVGGKRVDQLLGKTASDLTDAAPLSFTHPTTGMSEGEITSLLGAGCCVICDQTPTWKKGIPPVIHPIKMDAGYRQFICDDCKDNELAQPFLATPTVH